MLPDYIVFKCQSGTILINLTPGRAAGQRVLNKMMLLALPILGGISGYLAECGRNIKDSNHIKCVGRGGGHRADRLLCSLCRPAASD